MKRSHVGLTLLGLGLLACGGRSSVDDPGSDGAGASGPAPSGTTSASAGKSSASNSNSSGALPSKELGECKPGFDHAQNPTQRCRWITEAGTCFDTSDDACACVCPRQGHSICVQGNRSFDGAVLITCY